MEKADRYYKPSGRAIVEEGIVLCVRHRRKVARITERGVELWCKGDGGHPVMLTYEQIERALGRGK